MELKLGSVMLLLSCSLQQSLWGILASVPQTTANKCKSKISSEGAPTQRVQMIRRIPARCSGWDEAWSWISNKDCRTKYILDYVELPSAVQKVDQEDCEEEVATQTETGHFNLAEEKYLAIAFGSATVALLILIVIIVISVVRRGSNRCRICSSGPAYTSANASEREHLDASNTAGNEYVGDELKLAEPMYEEIHDRTTAKKKLEFNDDVKPARYQNLPEEEGAEKNGAKNLPPNGVHRRPVTPSAPYEEELQQTTRKCVPNDYSVFVDKLQTFGITDQVGKDSDNFNTGENIIDNADGECSKELVNVKPESDEINEQAQDIETVNSTGLPSYPSKTINDSKDCVLAESEDKFSHKSSHSYENLNKTGTASGDYESLATNDPCVSSQPMLQEQTSDQCFDSHTLVSDGDESSLKCVNIESMSTPVKLVSPSSYEDCHVNTIYMQPDKVTDSAKLENENNIADTCT
ncbi:uncharacterized protein LOC123549096 [Mercenaria mercenaria]|uniref:uncharacterized protein LOC123549096 n=1 Tax=Mercenaria mercenaria TaxID=6596 RepID=UPI00234F70D9|nr:uncharacterized protein LOC123549096 [Mercenaria mercenaria]XP_045192838.2 uncharacterized protein LOC123549096 [Mercenaria mercenaria]